MIVIVICIGGMLATAAPAFAVGNLLSALVKPNETPAAFSHSHVKVYHRFTTKMTVKSRQKGIGQGTATCTLPAVFARDGWTQGIIQSFDGPSILSAFDLCASLFSSSDNAHKAFGAEVADVTAQSKKQKGLKVKVLPNLGAEAIAVGGVQQGFAVWILSFRHDNAMVDLTYLGDTAYGLKDMILEAKRLDGRIS